MTVLSRQPSQSKMHLLLHHSCTTGTTAQAQQMPAPPTLTIT